MKKNSVLSQANTCAVKALSVIGLNLKMQHSVPVQLRRLVTLYSARVVFKSGVVTSPIYTSLPV